MSETLKEFIANRRRELDETEGPLREKLREIAKERDQLHRAALAAGFEIVPVTGSQGPRIFRSPRRLPEKTIKEAVVEILGERKGGMKALDILAEINKRFASSYPRTSLSPQLSRLKGENVIVLENNAWRLASDKPQKSKPQTPIFSKGMGLRLPITRTSSIEGSCVRLRKAGAGRWHMT